MLLVVGNDGLEEIAEALVATDIVLAGDLQKQALERIEAAQGVTGNGIGQPCSDHDEFMLAVAFRGAGGAPDCIVEPAKLALCAGIHIAHPAHNDMSLIVEIETVCDQFLDIDLRGAFAAPVTGSTSAGPPRPSRPRSPPRSGRPSFRSLGRGPPPRFSRGGRILASRSILSTATLFRFLLFDFSHYDSFRADTLAALNACRKASPFEANPRGRP